MRVLRLVDVDPVTGRRLAHPYPLPAAQPVVRRLERQVGPGTLLVGGHTVLAAGLTLWASSSAEGLFAGTVLEGASGSVLLGTYQATAARKARRGGGSAVMAVFGLSWGVATVTAPVIGASLLERRATSPVT